MIWQVPRIWEGGDVYILGGGPSVPVQFDIPNKIIQDVVRGAALPSVYSPYMSFLHDKHVIGVNVAFLIGDWIDMVFFGDNSFFLAYKNKLAEFPGIKISCHPHIEKYNWVKYLPKDNNHPNGISSNPKKVSWNNNSGSAAINIAVNAGAKRVILLGFDMKLNTNAQQHWHDLYHRLNAVNRKGKPVGVPFGRHLMGFPEIAKDTAKMGVEILNASPDSAICQFRKVTIKELIEEEELKKVKVLEYECD
jgi:hypothetical protein